METALTSGSTGRRVIGLEFGSDRVLGVLVESGEPARIMAFADADVDASDDPSIALAEVHAALLDGDDPVDVGITAAIDGGGTGPGDEVAATAERIADDLDRPIRWTKWDDVGVLAEASGVDRLAEMLDGTDIPVTRIELAEAAAMRCLKKSRLPLMPDRLRHCAVPKGLARSQRASSPEMLAPAVGVALATIDDRGPGDLRVHVAHTAIPETDPTTVTGWAVEPTRAPVDFEPPAERSTRGLRNAAWVLGVLALIMLIVLVVF